MNNTELMDLLHSPRPKEMRAAPFIDGLRADNIAGQTDLFARLAISASYAGSQTNATIAGHQVAVRRLFGNTPADAVTAFCVSEARGPHPRYIETRLLHTDQGPVITGQKMWGTMAPAADVLYIAASIGQEEGQNQLRMVAVNTNQSTIEQIPLPPERQAGDVPICDLNFQATAVREVLAEDAYSHYIKPFRLIEDVFSTVAMQIVLYRAGDQTRLTQTAREDLLALIIQGKAVAESDMASPGAILILTSYLRSSQRQWQEFGKNPSSDLAEYWQFDRPILKVAERARAQRRANAWADLGEPLADVHN